MKSKDLLDHGAQYTQTRAMVKKRVKQSGKKSVKNSGLKAKSRRTAKKPVKRVKKPVVKRSIDQITADQIKQGTTKPGATKPAISSASDRPFCYTNVVIPMFLAGYDPKAPARVDTTDKEATLASTAFVPGDIITWSSQASGFAKVKTGTILAVVPAGADANELMISLGYIKGTFAIRSQATSKQERFVVDVVEPRQKVRHFYTPTVLMVKHNAKKGGHVIEGVGDSVKSVSGDDGVGSTVVEDEEKAPESAKVPKLSVSDAELEVEIQKYENEFVKGLGG